MPEQGARFTIRELQPGSVSVEGELVLDTVAGALAQGLALIRPGETVSFDVSAVERGDSAAVALMVAWRRHAAHNGATLRFEGAGEQLRTIARTSNLQSLFQT